MITKNKKILFISLATFIGGGLIITAQAADYIFIKPSAVVSCNAGMKGSLSFSSDQLKFCDGSVWANVNTDLVGITSESDPTVTASVKDGVAWGELSGIPAGFADNVDNVGLTSESDPKVGTLTAGNWCTTNGSVINCASGAPILSESDPTVTASVKDGVAWGELSGIPAGFADNVDNVGLTSESDPKVGALTTNYISKWGALSLVNSAIFDNGNIGIGTTNPGKKLVVDSAGDTIAGWFKNSSATELYIGSAELSGDIVAIRSDPTNNYGNIRIWGDTEANGITIKSGGNVGIGTTDPGAYKLNVNGNVLIGDGATTGKLTVATIDPVYEIDGKKYATYVADFAGGVKTETSGFLQIRNPKSEILNKSQIPNSKFQTVIDFNNLEKGGDLWLFWETSNKNLDDIVVILTPGFDGRVWYEKNCQLSTVNCQLLIYSNKEGEVSYRLTAPRKDWLKWPNEINE